MRRVGNLTRSAFLGLVLWMLAPATAQASDAGSAAAPDENGNLPTVGANLDRVEAHVGDRLTLTVSAVGRSAVIASLRLPDPLSLDKFTILDVARSDRDLGEGKYSRRFVLQIAAYETGELEVPVIRLTFQSTDGTHEVATSPITVNIKSLLGDEGNPQLQPLKPPRQVMIEDDRPWRVLRRGALGLAVALTITLIILILRRRSRREKFTPPPPVVPPHLQAMRRLEDLRARGNFSREYFRPFYFELAEILRAYLGGRFGFDSLELTTSELLHEIEKRGVSLASRIAAFLDESDLVKFAKAPSDDARAAAALAEAESLVLTLGAPTTEAAPPPAVSEARRD